MTSPRTDIGQSGDHEPFEVFDEQGEPLGIEPRFLVHRRGLWHRAANVFLFDGQGRLLIQRRQLSKDVCPGAWDLSVAEHLAPGETFEEGARRGLREELGVTPARLEAIGRVARSQLRVAALGLRDNEFQQSFRATYTGPITPNASEVMQVEFRSLSELGSLIAATPEDFTPWLRQRLVDLQLLEGAQ